MAPGDGITRFHDRARRDRVFRGKCKQQRLLAGEMIEHPEQESRLVGGRADGFWANSGQRQEAAPRWRALPLLPAGPVHLSSGFCPSPQSPQPSGHGAEKTPVAHSKSRSVGGRVLDVRAASRLREGWSCFERRSLRGAPKARDPNPQSRTVVMDSGVPRCAQAPERPPVSWHTLTCPDFAQGRRLCARAVYRLLG